MEPYQELDESDFYKANLKTDGYSSIYIQRSGQKRDGCGIFYKDNRYADFSFFVIQDRCCFFCKSYVTQLAKCLTMCCIKNYMLY